ncbi:MAG: hypothetical protein IT210_06850 [Armatimonadetes bacterium]|nr:hypothetical protein [Armatimonadota bacterium]
MRFGHGKTEERELALSGKPWRTVLCLIVLLLAVWSRHGSCRLHRRAG